MDPDSYALVLAEDNENGDGLLVNQMKLSSTPSVKESEMQHSLTTPMMLTSEEVIIDAVPLSIALPDEANFSIPEKKNERPSLPRKEKNEMPSRKSTPKSRKTSEPQKVKYSAIWRCTSKQRTNGKWDKYYFHWEEKFICRSLKEVKRYEATGIRPKRSGKGKQKENTDHEEAVNILLHMLKMKEAAEMMITVEKFLEAERCLL